MDEYLNSVNAEQEPVVEAQAESDVETTDETEPAATGESESAAPAEQQTEEQEQKEAQSPEENSRWAAQRRKYESEKADAIRKARDETAAAIARRFNLNSDGREISSYEDFERFGIDLELKNTGIDPDVYAKLRENDPDVRKAKEVLEQQERSQTEMRVFSDFCNSFKETNGREFDPKSESDFETYAKVKQEADETGKDVADVYARHQVKSLLAERNALLAKEQSQTTNKANTAASPGSVYSDGQTAGAITQTDIDAHKNDIAWMDKHYDEVAKFYSKRKG